MYILGLGEIGIDDFRKRFLDDTEETRRKNEAAKDKMGQSATILAQMEGGDEEAKKTVPMWQSNVQRAEAELESIRDDRETALADLVKKRNPTFEFELLNAARIVVEESVDA